MMVRHYVLHKLYVAQSRCWDGMETEDSVYNEKHCVTIWILTVRHGDTLEFVLLLDGVTVAGSLGGVDQLVGQALGDGLDVAESSLPGSGAQQPDSLVDPPEGRDIDGLTPNGSLTSDTGGVLTGSGVDDGIDQDLEGVLVKGHLQLGDGHGHLLLDNLDLVLQSGVGLGQLSGQHVDLHKHLLLLGLEFGSGTGQTLLGVGTELGQLLLELGNTVKGLLLSGVGILVGTGQLLTLVAQLPVVAVQLGEPLLEGIKLHLHGLELILKLTTDTGQTLIGHLEPVHLIGDLENLLGASLAVTVSALVQVCHLLQLGAQLGIALVGATELLGQLPDDDLAVLDILDEDGDLLGQLVLLSLGGLQLLLQSVQGVGESINLNGELLLEYVGLLHPEPGLVLILLLPFSVVSLPLLNSSLKLDLDGSELLDLDVEGLNVPLQAHDLGLRSVARSGFCVSRPAEFIQLDSELVLVHACSYRYP